MIYASPMMTFTLHQQSFMQIYIIVLWHVIYHVVLVKSLGEHNKMLKIYKYLYIIL